MYPNEQVDLSTSSGGGCSPLRSPLGQKLCPESPAGFGAHEGLPGQCQTEASVDLERQRAEVSP